MGKAYNVMAATCPSRTVLHRIGARWTVFVVNALDDGPRRFTELKAHIQGITPKVLTETLRSLEADGLISRHEYDENPPRVEYALTPLGRSLLIPLRAVRLWAEQHVPDIEAARARRHRLDPEHVVDPEAVPRPHGVRTTGHRPADSLQAPSR